MGENSTNSSRKKHIWVLVFLLLIAIVITAWAYVSQLKKSTPTENANVIGLVPEDTTSVSEEVQEETATVSPQTGESDGSNEDKKSTVKKGATVYTAAQSQQRLVGYMDAEMTTVDGKGAWKSKTSVDIFDSTYYTTDDDATVKNTTDNWNLIAPGTEKSYSFWVKNTGSVDIDYKVFFEESSNPYDIPLEVRVKCGKQYILGNAVKWEPIEKLNKTIHKGSLSEKHYAQYTLEWRWPFEGDDELDTFLGDEAVKDTIEQKIVIHTYGEGDDSPIYETINIFTPKTGDSANVILWAGVAVCALLLIIIIKKRKDEKEDSNEEE